MGGRRERSAARLAGASAALVLAGVSAAGAARPTDSLRHQAHTLAARAHRALLDLYALDARQRQARDRLATLEAESLLLRTEQVRLERGLLVTRQALAASQRELGDRLAMLYKQGDVNTLAVLLGAQSLDDAVTRLDDLRLVADENRQAVALTLDRELRLRELQARLAERGAALRTTLAGERQTAAALASERTGRVAFIAALRHEQGLKEEQIHALEATAQHAELKSAAIQAAATQAAEPPVRPGPAAAVAPAAPGRRTITVTSTGYSLGGRTATGMPVGWGVVAVDPSVIPLGTRLTIPGYGEAVAADTGGAVRGATIDLWFPTAAQAHAWGRRTVTVTLH